MTEAAPTGRLITLDMMRGVAVLGILFANIVVFANPMMAGLWPTALMRPMEPADEGVWLAQMLLVDGRMRGLFTLLFGAGMLLFLERRSVGLQIRRLGWLALFGLAHYFLLFRGDILFAYAFCGVLSLAFAGLSAGRLLVLGGMAYGMGALVSGLMFWPMVPQELAFLATCGDMPSCMAQDGPVAEAYRFSLDAAQAESRAMQGGFAHIVAYQLTHHALAPLEGAVLSLLETLPLMLIGMGLYRAGLFSTGAASRHLLGWGLAGIALGIVFSLPLALWLMWHDHPLFLSSFVLLGPAQWARLPMIVGLAAFIAAGAPALARTAPGRRLIAAGRMAFSNYLGTSLIMAFVFQGWGLGWHGSFNRMELLLVVLAGWVAMLVWSSWWLARYRHGPMEWLWRCLVSGNVSSMSR